VAYELRIHREAQKELLELPNEVHNRVYQQLLELQREPRPRQAVKLKGREDLWRLRVKNPNDEIRDWGGPECPRHE
jgi:mRNA-degrading endonuclease RelE of RelBE toxin-antitoxin system